METEEGLFGKREGISRSVGEDKNSDRVGDTIKIYYITL